MTDCESALGANKPHWTSIVAIVVSMISLGVLFWNANSPFNLHVSEPSRITIENLVRGKGHATLLKAPIQLTNMGATGGVVNFIYLRVMGPNIDKPFIFLPIDFAKSFDPNDSETQDRFYDVILGNREEKTTIINFLSEEGLSYEIGTYRVEIFARINSSSKTQKVNQFSFYINQTSREYILKEGHNVSTLQTIELIKFLRNNANVDLYPNDDI